MASGLEPGGWRAAGGPSAFGRDWSRIWDLLILQAGAAFRRRYVNTTFGFAWTIINPLLLFAVLYLFVSEIIERFVDQVPDYGALLLFNIVLFQFFREGTTQAMRSLTTGGEVVRKAHVPRAVPPLGAVLAVFYTLLANLVVVLVWLLAAGIEPRLSWLVMPAVLAALVIFTCGVGLLLASLFARVRDVGQVWPVLSRVLFYASPILFPLEVIPKQILWDIQTYNPLAPLLVEARVWIVDANAPGWFEARGTGLDAFLPIAIGVALCLLGVLWFKREARRAAEDL